VELSFDLAALLHFLVNGKRGRAEQEHGKKLPKTMTPFMCKSFSWRSGPLISSLLSSSFICVTRDVISRSDCLSPPWRLAASTFLPGGAMNDDAFLELCQAGGQKAA